MPRLGAALILGGSRMVSSVTSLSSLRHHPRSRYRRCRRSLVLPKHKQVRDTGRADRDKPTRECDDYHESEASIIHSPPAFGSPNDRSPEIFVDRPSKFGPTSSEKR